MKKSHTYVGGQCVNSVYTVHNSKNCLPNSTNVGNKKKKKKKSRKRELINVDAEPKRSLRITKVFYSQNDSAAFSQLQHNKNSLAYA